MSDGVASGGTIRPKYDLYGGVALAVLAALLLAWSFYTRTPVPLAVKAAILVFAAAGIAVSAKLLKVQNQQDFYGGMALIFLALVAFVASNDLPGMRGFAFGPGTAPRLFALALAVLSAGVVIGGLLSEEQTTSTTKVPLLGDIPYLGALFRNTARVNNKSELLIFLTPRIISGTAFVAR